MTEEQVAKILTVISSIYDNFHPMDMKMTLTAWSAVLRNADPEAIEKALIAYISQDNAFAPKPGTLLQMATPKPEYLNEMQAWSMVRKAICNGLYGAEKEFEKFPDEVKRAVGDPGQLRAWAQGDIESLQTVVQSNFLRTYRGVLKAEDDRLKIGMANTLGIEADV